MSLTENAWSTRSQCIVVWCDVVDISFLVLDTGAQQLSINHPSEPCLKMKDLWCIAIYSSTCILCCFVTGPCCNANTPFMMSIVLNVELGYTGINANKSLWPSSYLSYHNGSAPKTFQCHLFSATIPFIKYKWHLIWLYFPIMSACEVDIVCNILMCPTLVMWS